MRRMRPEGQCLAIRRPRSYSIAPSASMIISLVGRTR